MEEWQKLNQMRDQAAASSGHTDWRAWYNADPLAASMAGTNTAFQVTGQPDYYDTSVQVTPNGGYTGTTSNLVAPTGPVTTLDQAINPYYGGKADASNFTSTGSLADTVKAAEQYQMFGGKNVLGSQTQGFSAAMNQGVNYSGQPSAPVAPPPPPAPKYGEASDAKNWLKDGQVFGLEAIGPSSWRNPVTGREVMAKYGQGQYSGADNYTPGELEEYWEIVNGGTRDNRGAYRRYNPNGDFLGEGNLTPDFNMGKTALGYAAMLAGTAGVGSLMQGAAAGAGTGMSNGAFLGEGLHGAGVYGANGAVLGTGAGAGMGAAVDGAAKAITSVVTSNPIIQTAIKAVASTGVGTLLNSITGDNKGGGTKTSGGGVGGTDFGMDDIVSLLLGNYGKNKQENASDEMLNYIKEQQAKIDRLYAPGSEESKHLWEEMSRKDAAAGRNSQYGERTKQFQGQVAKEKSDQTIRLTNTLAPLMQAAVNQKATAPAEITSRIGQMLKGQGINLGAKGLDGLTAALTRAYKSGETVSTQDIYKILEQDKDFTDWVDWTDGQMPTEVDVWEQLIRDTGIEGLDF